MRLTKFAVAAVVAGACAFGGVAALHAEEMGGGGTTPAVEKKGAGKKLKLPKRYNELTGLTDEQRQQIDAIHDKAVAEMKLIEERERTDILSVLTAEQRAELTAADERAVAERKGKAGKKKDDPTAATQPAAAGE
jgi:Spy/CpxP family protein refolding chaperone